MRLMGERIARARGIIIVVLIAGCVAPAVGRAADSPAFTGFHSVLAQGEGQTVNAVDLAANQANGTVPPSFLSQNDLYSGVMPKAATLTTATLDEGYKNTTFGTMPGGVASTTTPEPGVTISRDGAYNMAHIYGGTRSELMFGAGYAQAQERLFLMDVLRRTSEGTLAGLLGPSAASGDAAQLTDQDFSAQELTGQINALPQKFGAVGSQARQDLVDYVAGINAYIQAAQLNPLLLPAEYAALGATPAPWTLADTAATAVLLVSRFTVSNGDEQVNEQLRLAFRRRFGKRWPRYYGDLRESRDPEKLTVAKRPFLSDNTGRVEPRLNLNALPDLGSLVPRNAEIQGPDAAQASAARSAAPAWVRGAESLRTVIPHVESNALMVARKFSADAQALAAMGPQVGYYSPQIFSEYELHGGGIDSEGVVFPGADPFPLIGHGIDFSWSGTSANGDNEDTFVERLCNPDGSPPSKASTHYLYKGSCIPFLMRRQSVTTPVAPTAPGTPSQTITYQTMRSIHGPVFEFATVSGKPVALTKAKAVDFHELSAIVPFMQLSENQATDVHSFIRIMRQFPGTENWFYVDRRDVGWIQSGYYQRHAPHSDVELPWWGDGRADWVGFNPTTYTESDIPASHNPTAINPHDGFIISWNNVEAQGWQAPPTSWDSGPIQHALILQERLKAEVRRTHGRVTLGGVARVADLTATTDLRGEDLYPLMRRVIGHASGQTEQILRMMDTWHAAGSQRLAPEGSNIYAHSPAIIAFDAWWPRFVTAEFQPVLGPSLMRMVEDNVLSLPQIGFNYNWTSQMYKDLRDVLGVRSERGRYSHIYCGRSGGGLPEPASGLRGRALARVRAQCRATLLSTLGAGLSAVEAKLGNDPGSWQKPATCPKTNPHSCDQEVPTTAGAIDTPPFPWQDRGTYHQVIEVSGHR